jgi:transposase InsO family protein
LLGPLPPAQGNLKYAVVAVEYFSKWIEAKSLTTITSTTLHKFFWKNIVCRFGMPKAITVDNGTQFDAETFKTFCDQIGTEIHFASVRHPESNGLVERANRIIITRIMKSIFNPPKGKWPGELIKVVWNHNTVFQGQHDLRHSSFCLVTKQYVTPRGFKGQSRVHLIYAPKKTTYIITECIEINVTL